MHSSFRCLVAMRKRDINTLFMCSYIYIAPVPETGFGEDDTATVGPIYLHVTKFGKKVKILKK